MSTTTSGGESIQRVRSGHQSRFILAVVCVASVMCATSARAQPPPKVSQTVVNEQDFPFGDLNKCTTPYSNVAGQGHFHLEVMTRSDFANDYTITIYQNGTGTNTTIADDTAPYQFNYSSTDRFRSSTPNFTFTTHKVRKHMIRQGPLPSPLPSWLPDGKADYFFYDSVTVSPNSPPSRNSNKSESTCK